MKLKQNLESAIESDKISLLAMNVFILVVYAD
jgi:hypothetical protein